MRVVLWILLFAQLLSLALAVELSPLEFCVHQAKGEKEAALYTQICRLWRAHPGVTAPMVHQKTGAPLEMIDRVQKRLAMLSRHPTISETRVDTRLAELHKERKFNLTRINLGYERSKINKLERVRIVVVCDTHNLSYLNLLPPGDILLHGGDFSFKGEPEEVAAFNDWLGRQTQITHKLVIEGNHEKQPEILKASVTNGIVLQDEPINLLGVKIYGTKWKPDWKKIPSGLHILLTHPPPKGILDKDHKNNSVGFGKLFSIIEKTKPQLNIFGHNHKDYGVVQDKHTVYINCAVCVAAPRYSTERRPAMFFDFYPSLQVDTSIPVTMDTVIYPDDFVE